MHVVNTVTAFVVLIAVGWFAAKRGFADQNFAKGLSKILFNITLPSMIITSMQFEFTPEILMKSGALILAGLTIILVGFLIGWLFSLTTNTKSYFKRIIISVMGIPNFSFMGYPIAMAVYGAEGLFYAVIFSLPFFVVANSFGTLILNEKEKFGFRKLINAPTAAVLIGFTLFLFSVQLPEIIGLTLEYVGQPTIPMAMILAGILLATAPLKTMFKEWRYFAVSAIRLVLFPLVVYIVLSAIGFDGMLLGVPVIITMMPAAVKIIIFAANFDGDATTAAQITMVSTLLSVITIPLIVFFLL